MKYDHIPRPHVEEHYHIRELIENQEKRSADRTFHRERIKALEEREDLIKDAPIIVLTDFYCQKCKKDFKGTAPKIVETDWSNPSQRVAYYKSKCFKGHWVVRWLTDKFKDPYFFRSKWIANDRAKHSNDILQSFQSGYNLLYGKK
jgi:hypothetical protein